MLERELVISHAGMVHRRECRVYVRGEVWRHEDLEHLTEARQVPWFMRGAERICRTCLRDGYTQARRTEEVLAHVNEARRELDDLRGTDDEMLADLQRVLHGAYDHVNESGSRLVARLLERLENA